MQNSSLSLLATLCLSTAMFVLPVMAQDAPAAPNPATAPAQNEPVATPELAQSDSAGKPAPVLDEKEQERQRLDAELSNTQVNSGEILDFPARTSLGELEMAPLPGIKESLITGPAPMAPSVSTKDLPSEQLLGRITSEVFQEMADLERGNVFLKLQMQKEQLKNDLEKLKATYRQTRLDEIAKREDVVRSRINWWQEQENVRLEMEKKKAETESIEQQIAEAEELRNKLRADAIAEKEAKKEKEANAVSDASDSSDTIDDSVAETIDENAKIVRANEVYSLLTIRGMKGKLSATLENLNDASTVVVKIGDKLPTGHIVKEITKDTIVFTADDREDVLLFNSQPSSNAPTGLSLGE